MLATEKISKAFKAIIEEAEKLKNPDNNEEVSSGLAIIISIAKHQSDIRDSKGGSCQSHKSCH